jgi:hypothetical protein
MPPGDAGLTIIINIQSIFRRLDAATHNPDMEIREEAKIGLPSK